MPDEQAPDWYSLEQDEEVIDGRHRSIIPYLGKIFSGVVISPIIGAALSRAYPSTSPNVQLGIATFVSIAGLIYSTYQYLLYRSTYYLLTNKNVAKKEGLFSRRADPIHLTDIVDTEYHQSFVDKILNIGTVRIETAGTLESGKSADIEMRHIPSPQDFHDKVKDYKNRFHDDPTSDDGEPAYPDK